MVRRSVEARHAVGCATPPAVNDVDPCGSGSREVAAVGEGTQAVLAPASRARFSAPTSPTCGRHGPHALADLGRAGGALAGPKTTFQSSITLIHGAARMSPLPIIGPASIEGKFRRRCGEIRWMNSRWCAARACLEIDGGAPFLIHIARSAMAAEAIPARARRDRTTRSRNATLLGPTSSRSST